MKTLKLNLLLVAFASLSFAACGEEERRYPHPIPLDQISRAYTVQWTTFDANPSLFACSRRPEPYETITIGGLCVLDPQGPLWGDLAELKKLTTTGATVEVDYKSLTDLSVTLDGVVYPVTNAVLADAWKNETVIVGNLTEKTYALGGCQVIESQRIKLILSYEESQMVIDHSFEFPDCKASEIDGTAWFMPSFNNSYLSSSLPNSTYISYEAFTQFAALWRQ